MLIVRWKALRASHSSPSSGTLGNPATNHASAWNTLPCRDRHCLLSQKARRPSSISLSHQPAGSVVVSPVRQASSHEVYLAQNVFCTRSPVKMAEEGETVLE